VRTIKIIKIIIKKTTDLQFGQRDDIAIVGPMPYRTLTGRVVVIEPRSLVIEQLPPLAVRSPFAAKKHTKI
jgi:hypothetical protein